MQKLFILDVITGVRMKHLIPLLLLPFPVFAGEFFLSAGLTYIPEISIRHTQTTLFMGQTVTVTQTVVYPVESLAGRFSVGYEYEGCSLQYSAIDDGSEFVMYDIGCVWRW